MVSFLKFERFASGYKYAKLSINVINTVLNQMNQRAVSSTGNHYTFIVNDILWGQINTTLGDWLKAWQSTALYSKKAGGYVNVDNPLK